MGQKKWHSVVEMVAEKVTAAGRYQPMCYAWDLLYSVKSEEPLRKHECVGTTSGYYLCHAKNHWSVRVAFHSAAYQASSAQVRPFIPSVPKYSPITHALCRKPSMSFGGQKQGKHVNLRPNLCCQDVLG